MNTVTGRAAGAGVELETPRPDGDECSMEPGHALLMLLLTSQKTNIVIQGFLIYHFMPKGPAI